MKFRMYLLKIKFNFKRNFHLFFNTSFSLFLDAMNIFNVFKARIWGVPITILTFRNIRVRFPWKPHAHKNHAEKTWFHLWLHFLLKRKITLALFCFGGEIKGRKLWRSFYWVLTSSRLIKELQFGDKKQK